MATFVAYGLGMGATLAVLTIAVALAKQGIVARFRSLLPYIHTISGVLLILAGIFVAYYAWVEIQELEGNGSSAVVDWARDIQSSLQRWAESQGAGRLLVGRSGAHRRRGGHLRGAPPPPGGHSRARDGGTEGRHPLPRGRQATGCSLDSRS